MALTLMPHIQSNLFTTVSHGELRKLTGGICSDQRQKLQLSI